MKSVLIVYSEVLAEELLDLLNAIDIRGFTRWNEVQGRGSTTGEPHLGTHTWPGLNGAMVCVVDDERVDDLLDALRQLQGEGRGLRAFVSNIERAI